MFWLVRCFFEDEDINRRRLLLSSPIFLFFLVRLINPGYDIKKIGLDNGWICFY